MGEGFWATNLRKDDDNATSFIDKVRLDDHAWEILKTRGVNVDDWHYHHKWRGERGFRTGKSTPRPAAAKTWEPNHVARFPQRKGKGKGKTGAKRWNIVQG